MSVRGIPDEVVNQAKAQLSVLSDSDMKLLRDSFCLQVQQTMRVDQWYGTKQYLDSLSDTEAYIWCFAYLGMPQNQGELDDVIEKKINENHVSSTNSALYASGVEYADQHIIDYVSRKLNNSKPSEEFLFTHKTDCEIQSFWMKDFHKLNGVPSDLLFSKKLPILDCIVTVDERNDFSYGQICKSRVCVFKDYEEIVDKIEENNQERDEINFMLGAVTMYMDNPYPWKQIVPFGSQSKGKLLVCFQPYTEGLLDNERKNLNTVSNGMISQMVSGVMSTWYGVEFSLYAGIKLKSKKL